MRVVLEHALAGRSAVLPRPAEPAVRAAGARARIASAARRRRRRGTASAVGSRASAPRGIGERRDRQPVPRRERLVVARRLRPLGRGARAARSGPRQASATSARDRRIASPSSSSADARQDRAALPVAVVGHAVRRREERARRRRARRGSRRRVQVNVAPSTPLGVRVLARGERAVVAVAARGACSRACPSRRRA